MLFEVATQLAAQGVDVAAWMRTRGVIAAARLNGVWRVRWRAVE